MSYHDRLRVARRPHPSASPQSERARIHLLGLYGLLGLTLATWLSRIPAVRTSLDLTTGELGGVLLIGSLGSFAMVLLAGGLTSRWGDRRTLVVSAWGFAASTALLGLGPALGLVAVLVAGVFALNASLALGAVAMNVQAVVVERHLGRTAVPHFHAAFSVGTVVGSALGALAAWGQVSPAAQFALIGALGIVWRLRSIPHAVLPHLGDDGTLVQGASGFRDALRAWRDRRTLLLALVVMAGALSEGTANNWLAVAVVDGFGGTEAAGAFLFSAFVLAMTAARFAGNRLVDRFGTVGVLLVSTSSAVLGLAAFALVQGLAGATAAVFVWGLGTGLVLPLAMAAATGTGPGAAGRVAVVSAFGSTANVGAPPVIGAVAELIGLRPAMIAVAVVMIVGVVLARSARPAPSVAQVPLATTETDAVRCEDDTPKPTPCGVGEACGP